MAYNLPLKMFIHKFLPEYRFQPGITAQTTHGRSCELGVAQVIILVDNTLGSRPRNSGSILGIILDCIGDTIRISSLGTA